MFEFRKADSTQHAKLLASCQKFLDKGGLIRSIAMNLWIANECPPPELLLVKIQAYGFS